MRRIRSLTCLMFAVIGLAMPGVAQAAPPATLTGEQFNSVGGPGSVNCDAVGDFSFTASGVATGPYSGTFTETGTGTISQIFFGPVTAFSASFTVLSPSGDVLVRGTKSLDPTVPNPSVGCLSPPNVGIVFGIPTAYVATIVTPAGDYRDEGTSIIQTLFSDPSSTFLDERFASTLPQPVLLPPTNKDQCKNGGWRNYPQFKNEGDCVSFVATSGKSPPSGS